MKFLLHQLEVPLTYDTLTLTGAVARKLNCPAGALRGIVPVRRSVDARPRRNAPVFIISAEVEVVPDSGWRPPQSKDIEALPVSGKTDSDTAPSNRVFSGTDRPMVVGTGPAGLMAGLQLARAGARPVIIERGGPVSERREKVEAFWHHGTLDPECNVLFGAGGAGLFSDGKLTARSKERELMRSFFSTLVECGAPDSILIDAEPHLGSDALLGIVDGLTAEIVGLGGEIRYHCRCDGVMRSPSGQLSGLIIDGKETPAAGVILAIGHSARDTYRSLARSGVALEAKPFAVGVRLELPQPMIDQAMFGRFAGHPKLGAAGFRLTRREEHGVRACYSFCMCPGGVVIACSATEGMLTTNGMSFSQRSAVVGNAAFLVPVTPADFPAGGEAVEPEALAGLTFQEHLEKAAFQAGGGEYCLPASSLADFLAGRVPVTLPEIPRSCLRAAPADFGAILPEFVLTTLRSAIPRMLQQLTGVTLDRVLLYAAETRSSSPVRIVRDESGVSVNTPGLYPAGEGAGYAGGIVSSALDGMKAAEALLQRPGASPGSSQYGSL
jgi:hypothetical protein